MPAMYLRETHSIWVQSSVVFLFSGAPTLKNRREAHTYKKDASQHHCPAERHVKGDLNQTSRTSNETEIWTGSGPIPCPLEPKQKYTEYFSKIDELGKWENIVRKVYFEN